MKNIAFIINPISGGKEAQSAKRKLPKLIMQTLDMSQWLPNIVFTEYAGHATELAYQFARMGFDAVVAVGGDGTVNEVARGLVKGHGLQVTGSGTAMGIIPMGSGNGFARHINVPMRPQRAIEMINKSEPINVDYGLANGKLFMCTCGTGFDAVVADKFAASNKRGFMTYVQNTIKQVFTYQPQSYHIVGDGLDVTHKAFLITFANANQWGYEALIAPKASMQDGKMDIMCVCLPAVSMTVISWIPYGRKR